MLRLRRNPAKRLAYGANQASRPAVRFFKRLLKVFFIIILLVAIGFGAWYWYINQNSPSPKVVEIAPEPVKTVEPKKKVDETKKVGVWPQFLQETVEPGGDMELTVRTNALATCTLEVVYDTSGAEVEFDDSNLKPQKADQYGTASWSWTVPPTAPRGPAAVDATCANKKNWAHVTADFEVK